jgi:NAD(P)-dependent dehydrogenase (short-subunit alcohol dehydrogenase family)
VAIELDLAGRKAIVTGASEGIGRAIALRLAAEGVDLCVAARNRSRLEELAKQAGERHGVAVTVVAADLAQSAGQQELARAAGDADILVNNAGAIPGGTLEQIDEQTWRQGWDLKVFGYINLCRELYPRMRARGRGVILNIIGSAGERPLSGYIAGASANAALMAFTRALGGDSPQHGVRVVGLNPGPVATERLRELMQEMAREQFGDASRYEDALGPLPFGRAATQEEIADMVALLVSDRSAYTSGTIVTIDAGMTYQSA